MAEALFAKERVITGRRPELDFAKGICIIGLVLVHCYEEILGAWDSGLGTSIVEYLGYPIGAPLFMFCMGMTTIFSRHNTTKGYLIRGIGLLIVGTGLNIIRYGIVYGILFLTEGEAMYGAMSILIVSSDILQFAGIAFLLFALLSKLKAKPLTVLAVGIGLNIVGMLLEGVETGCYPLDQVLGLFWGTYTESYFPAFNWFIFAATGYTYGHYYVRCTNLKKWYAVIIPIGIVLSAIYYFVGIGVEQDIIRIFDSEAGFNFINLLDAIGCIVVSVTFIGILWLISQTGLKLKGLCYVSKHINKYYCVSMVWIYIMMMFDYLEFISVETDLHVVICAVVAFALTTFTIFFYRKCVESWLAPWCTKHFLPICITIVVVAIAWIILGYHFVDVIYLDTGELCYPNMFNNYYDY